MKLKSKRNTVVVCMVLAILISSICPQTTIKATSKIKLSKTFVTLKVGESTKIVLKNAKANKVTWNSSKNTIVIVKNGKISARKEGTAIVTAKYKKKKYKCTIKVKNGNALITPYQKNGDVDYNKTVQMAGVRYQQAVLYDIYSSQSNSSNYVLYNLNGEYDTFSFTYGHVDNKYMDECTLSIYLDGELVDEYTNLNAEMMPQNAIIDVRGASQMKIDCRVADPNEAGLCGTYALANLNFHKKGSSTSKTTSNGKCVITASQPYQTCGDVDYNKIVKMAGNTYQQSILYDIYSSRSDISNYVLYNLDGKYNTFSFTYGHCDDRYTDDCMLTIYLDGRIVAQYTNLTAEMMPQKVSIDVSGASQMKIDCRVADPNEAGLCGTYALTNLKFQ